MRDCPVLHVVVFGNMTKEKKCAIHSAFVLHGGASACASEVENLLGEQAEKNKLKKNVYVFFKVVSPLAGAVEKVEIKD